MTDRDTEGRPIEKLPIGNGDVFWSDGGKQIRIFGETTSLRGPTAVLERVAMRILHLVDGHGGYAAEADTECMLCRRMREQREAARQAVMTEWVIFGNEDKTEAGLATREGYEAQPLLQIDTSGEPMTVWAKFLAPSYEEAKRRYQRFMGF